MDTREAWLIDNNGKVHTVRISVEFELRRITGGTLSYGPAVALVQNDLISVQLHRISPLFSNRQILRAYVKVPVNMARFNRRYREPLRELLTELKNRNGELEVELDIIYASGGRLAVDRKYKGSGPEFIDLKLMGFQR